ncbi:MAG: hypothetical protein M3R70_05325 [Actinomycetota bacterium]|nr:hypothetical protein [Actinomycetota bacterium]
MVPLRSGQGRSLWRDGVVQVYGFSNNDLLVGNCSRSRRIRLARLRVNP